MFLLLNIMAWKLWSSCAKHREVFLLAFQFRLECENFQLTKRLCRMLCSCLKKTSAEKTNPLPLHGCTWLKLKSRFSRVNPWAQTSNVKEAPREDVYRLQPSLLLPCASVAFRTKSYRAHSLLLDLDFCCFLFIACICSLYVAVFFE